MLSAISSLLITPLEAVWEWHATIKHIEAYKKNRFAFNRKSFFLIFSSTKPQASRLPHQASNTSFRFPKLSAISLPSIPGTIRFIRFMGYLF